MGVQLIIGRRPDGTDYPVQLDASGYLLASSTQFPARGTTLQANGATYRAVGIGYAAYATPTDMIQITGSATKTVLVTKLLIAPTATGAGNADYYWIKRTAANTGGTVSAQTAAKLDSAAAAATAVVNLYSVIPDALGTSGGTLDIAKNHPHPVLTGQPSRAGIGAATIFGTADNTGNMSTPVILRGVAQSLNINFNGAALPSGFATAWYVEWVEF